MLLSHRSGPAISRMPAKFMTSPDLQHYASAWNGAASKVRCGENSANSVHISTKIAIGTVLTFPDIEQFLCRQFRTGLSCTVDQPAVVDGRVVPPSMAVTLTIWQVEVRVFGRLNARRGTATNAPVQTERLYQAKVDPDHGDRLECCGPSCQYSPLANNETSLCVGHTFC